MNKFIDVIAWWLVVLGGINWGLVGAFNFNLVAQVFSVVPVLVIAIYILIGLSAIYLIFRRFYKG